MDWLSSLVNEFQGKSLQRSGMISREQVLQFIDNSSAQFASAEFRQTLRTGVSNGQGAEDIVNRMQSGVFETLGVDGEHGIACLQHVQTSFADDQDLLRRFYDLVQREELLLDEVELPPEVFQAKYSQMLRLRKAVEEQTKGMTPDEQQHFVAELVNSMMREAKTRSQTAQQHQGEGNEGMSAMSPEEQLAFFQSLDKQ